MSEAYSWCFMAKPFVICHGGGNRGTGSHCARNSRLCMHVCVIDRSFVLQLLWLSRSRSSLFIVPSVSGELSVICSKIAAIIAGLADIISRLERTSYAAGSILITIECTDGDTRKTPVYGNTCIVHCLSISTLLDSTSIKRDLIAIWRARDVLITRFDKLPRDEKKRPMNFWWVFKYDFLLKIYTFRNILWRKIYLMKNLYLIIYLT